jgi:hypothetical protein
MRRNAFIQGMALLLLQAHAAAGKDSTQIVIESGGLSKPIVISDPSVVGRFRVATGPGTFELRPDGSRLVNMNPGFIIDWSRGAASAPGPLPQYQVSFTTGHGVYVVSYAIDPSTQNGYVYIPGVQDPQFTNNTRMLTRGVEGKWFYAWSAWEQVANTLIAGAKANH